MPWGAADERLPRGSEVRASAGTTACMAPEMLARPSDRLSVATAVYSLGASIYDVLAVVPLRLAPSALGVMMRVLDARPEPLLFVPDALATVRMRATAASPEDRSPTALALRKAIGARLEHRTSFELATEVQRRLTSLAGLSPDLTGDSARTRRHFAVVPGLFWCAFPLDRVLHPTDALKWGQVVGGAAVAPAVALALTLCSRRALTKTAVIRRGLYRHARERRRQAALARRGRGARGRGHSGLRRRARGVVHPRDDALVVSERVARMDGRRQTRASCAR